MSDLVRLFRPDADRRTVLSSHGARNRDLSRKAKGLLYELHSLPARGWQIRHTWLEDIATDGWRRLQGAVTELKEHGYLRIYQKRSDGGQFGETVWAVTDDPENYPLPDPQTGDADELLKAVENHRGSLESRDDDRIPENRVAVSRNAGTGTHSKKETSGTDDRSSGRTPARGNSTSSRRTDGKPSGPGDVTYLDETCPDHPDQRLTTKRGQAWCSACAGVVEVGA